MLRHLRNYMIADIFMIISTNHKSGNCRLILAAMHYNENAGRDVKWEDGKPKQKVVYSRAN